MKLALAATAAILLAVIAPASLAQMPPPTQTPAALPADVAQWVTPGLRQWQAQSGRLTLPSAGRIVVPAKADAELIATANGLSRDLASIGGPSLSVVKTGQGKAGDIVLVLADPATASTSPEAYGLGITDRVVIRARGRAGLFYGGQSLLQMLKYDPARRSLPRGEARDWPDYGMRAMMVDVGRKYYEVNQLDNLMREMAWLKMNMLHLHFTVAGLSPE